MAASLGFRFKDEKLRRGIYYPQGHSDREIAQLPILNNLKLLLLGETTIKMKVVEFPSSPEAAAIQSTLAEKLSKAYAEDGALKVSIVGGQEPRKPER